MLGEGETHFTSANIKLIKYSLLEGIRTFYAQIPLFKSL